MCLVCVVEGLPIDVLRVIWKPALDGWRQVAIRGVGHEDS
jgi:hypothetical protein